MRWSAVRTSAWRSRQPASMACIWPLVPATGSPRSRPTSPTPRAASLPAACRSCSSPGSYAAHDRRACLDAARPPGMSRSQSLPGQASGHHHRRLGATWRVLHYKDPCSDHHARPDIITSCEPLSAIVRADGAQPSFRQGPAWPRLPRVPRMWAVASTSPTLHLPGHPISVQMRQNATPSWPTPRSSRGGSERRS